MLGKGSALECFAAVIESIVFLIAANAEELRRQNAAAARVLLSGGLSRSDWMCRRLASLLGVPVERAEREASARGVAVLAAPDLAAAWPLTPATRFEPRPDAALASRYARFRAELQQRAAASQPAPRV
jgi:glycerol kinase